MRIIFAGTPEVAIPTLAALTDSKHQVVGVITRPPKRRGRSKKLFDSDVAAWAKERGLPVLETEKPGQETNQEWIKARNADLAVVVAYGSILPQSVLDLPKHGWLNLHFSQLPHLRGAAPVQHAVLRGDKEIGCTVFRLDAGMDTGLVLSSVLHPLSDTVTSGEALQFLAIKGAAQMLESVNQVAGGTAVFTPQVTGVNNEFVTYAPKLEREIGFIDFQASAAEVSARIRAVTPSPGAWTTLPGGTVLKLGPVQIALEDEENAHGALVPGEVSGGKQAVKVLCNPGVVTLGEVAPAGKKWMKAADWWRGARLESGEQLGGRIE